MKVNEMKRQGESIFFCILLSFILIFPASIILFLLHSKRPKIGESDRKKELLAKRQKERKAKEKIPRDSEIETQDIKTQPQFNHYFFPFPFIYSAAFFFLSCFFLTRQRQKKEKQKEMREE